MVVNNTKQNVYYFIIIRSYNTFSEKYKLRVTNKGPDIAKEKREGKKNQDKSNPAPELIACRSLTRSTRSLVYVGS